MCTVKRCKVCGHAYSRPEFLALPPPASGEGVAHGLIWRNCDQPNAIGRPCEATLVVHQDEFPTITTKQPESS